MKLIGKTLMFGLLAAATAVACSSGHQAAPGSSQTVGTPTAGASNGVGEVGMALTLPGGEHISLLTYKLTNGINTYPGQYNVTNTVTPSFVIANVAAGTGYQLTLSATTDDGKSTCSFPAADATNTQNISVVNRTTTTVAINMQCVVNQGLDSGSILVNAMTNNCPVWNSIVANPYNITLDAGLNVNDSGTAGSTAFFPNQGVPVKAVIADGQSLVLVAGATGPNPGALGFTWTTTGGTLSSPSGQTDPNSNDAGTTNQTIFTCPASGATTDEVITLTLTDGALDAASCDTNFTTGTVTVTCSNPGPCGGGSFATTAGGVCAPASTDGFPFVASTTADPASGDFCCAHACGDGTVGTLATTFPSGTGGCTAPNVNNGQGCCVGIGPCTTAGQTNCLPCAGEAGGVCTATEQILIKRDIAHNAYTPSPLALNPATSCYSCMFNNGGLDDTSTGGTDHGNECEDVTGSATLTGITGTAACLATLQCIVNNACVTAGSPPTAIECLCGSAAGSACLSNGAANGPCLQTEINGLDIGTGTVLGSLVEGDPTATNKAFSTKTLGSGQANFLEAFAGGNCAAQCTP